MTTNDWKVLVVEDEADSMELVQELFHHYGIHSIGATSGEEALQILETETPTLIIIDLALPGIDGWGLLAALKNKRSLSHIPRVAITAYHTAEVANQAIEKGFDAYFSKPLDATSFVRELQGIVGD
ncbi:MAG: response regulator [Chitinophagaceae bacterium]|nr:response regulator [Anaerolineae bacterium]